MIFLVKIHKSIKIKWLHSKILKIRFLQFLETNIIYAHKFCCFNPQKIRFKFKNFKGFLVMKNKQIFKIFLLKTDIDSVKSSNSVSFLCSLQSVLLRSISKSINFFFCFIKNFFFLSCKQFFSEKNKSRRKIYFLF